MAQKTLKDLFVHELSDIYSAERQLTRALPKMARAATDPALAEAFTLHLEETRGQVERIDKIVEGSDFRLKRIKCASGMQQKAPVVSPPGGPEGLYLSMR